MTMMATVSEEPPPTPQTRRDDSPAESEEEVTLKTLFAAICDVRRGQDSLDEMQKELREEIKSTNERLDGMQDRLDEVKDLREDVKSANERLDEMQTRPDVDVCEDVKSVNKRLDEMQGRLDEVDVREDVKSASERLDETMMATVPDGPSAKLLPLLRVPESECASGTVLADDGDTALASEGVHAKDDHVTFTSNTFVSTSDPTVLADDAPVACLSFDALPTKNGARSVFTDVPIIASTSDTVVPTFDRTVLADDDPLACLSFDFLPMKTGERYIPADVEPVLLTSDAFVPSFDRTVLADDDPVAGRKQPVESSETNAEVTQSTTEASMENKNGRKKGVDESKRARKDKKHRAK